MQHSKSAIPKKPIFIVCSNFYISYLNIVKFGFWGLKLGPIRNRQEALNQRSKNLFQ